MNIQIDHDSPASQDFFFRTADRMRIEGCANAVAREGLNLVLSSPHEVLLDHYLQLLLERLRRQAPEHRLEVYFPANTESLIARFNEVLAQQSVQQASQQASGAQGAQIWIVHDAHRLPDHEMQLLARLIQNFPGANIRAILLMAGASSTRESLAALGRKVLRWDIEAPTAEQAEDALERAQALGQGAAMMQLLRRMGSLPRNAQDPAALAAQAPAAEPAPAAAPAASAHWGQRLRTGLETLRHKTGDLSAWRERLRQIPPSRWRLIGAGMVLLAVSAGLTLWLQSRSAPATAARSKTSVAAPAAATAPAAAVQASEASRQEPAPVVTEVPDPASQNQAWARALDPNSFLIQHGSAATYQMALDLQKKYAGLGQARIVAAYRPGESLAHFVVVSGPFDPVKNAYEASRRRDIPGNSWVRPTRSLQEQLQATAPQKGTRT